MPPKQLPNGDQSKAVTKDAEDASESSTKTDEQTVTYAWGVPVKRVIQPDVAKTSPDNTPKPKPKYTANRNASQHQKIDSYADTEEPYEEGGIYEDEANEDQDEDTSSERDWSGAEYEDKIAGGSKIQTARVSPVGNARGSGLSRVHMAASSMYLRDGSLTAKKKKSDEKKASSKEEKK